MSLLKGFDDVIENMLTQIWYHQGKLKLNPPLL